MRKLLKFISFILIIMGIMFAIVNFITTDSDAERSSHVGTVDAEGACIGEPLNC